MTNMQKKIKGSKSSNSEIANSNNKRIPKFNHRNYLIYMNYTQLSREKGTIVKVYMYWSIELLNLPVL